VHGGNATAKGGMEDVVALHLKRDHEEPGAFTQAPGSSWSRLFDGNGYRVCRLAVDGQDNTYVPFA
jgi:hypothetical protein